MSLPDEAFVLRLLMETHGRLRPRATRREHLADLFGDVLAPAVQARLAVAWGLDLDVELGVEPAREIPEEGTEARRWYDLGRQDGIAAVRFMDLGHGR